MRVAPTDLSVLILGESGVGKDVFSHIIHSLSPRKHNGFIAVNCGAIPKGTIDSELFGHEKGAFTGSSDKRKGYFETVDGGTIFLDEIGEMPQDTQARLLRVLESGEFIRVGSSKVIRTNVRIIAATNVNLLEAVKSGKFREDLYYRLNTVPIYIPPLRDRKEDIYLLFRKFSVDFAERHRMSPINLLPPAKQILENYPWPGNIRELKNMAEQISVLATDRVIDAKQLLDFLPKNAAHLSSTRFPMISSPNKEGNNDFSERELLYKVLFELKKDMNEVKQILLQFLGEDSLPPVSPTNKWPAKNYTAPTSAVARFGDTDTPIVLNKTEDYGEYNTAEIVEESLSIAEKEKELILKALRKHNGKRKDAAPDLGISERTLYRKIKEYDIKE